MLEAQTTFRFALDELQASLTALLTQYGYKPESLVDGTLRIPPGQSIERLIDQVIDSVFPDAYQRTEITDPVTAERYRQFTRRHGTSVVEEIRDGQSHFVRALREKLYRCRGIPTHVCFALLGDDLDPGYVTTTLGITPTSAGYKGAPFARQFTGRRKDAPPYPARTGWWELSSLPEVESNDVERHLTWLLERLEPVAEEVARMGNPPTADGPRILQLNVVRPRESTGVSLPGTLTTRIGTLCDRADLRIGRDDYL